MQQMAVIAPVVRHMIVCEEVILDPVDPRRITFVNLLSTISAPSGGAFPLTVPLLSAFLWIAGGRGTGTVKVVVLQGNTGHAVFTSASQTIHHPVNPLQAATMIFRIRRCVFPLPGLYYFQFLHDDRVLSEQAVVVT
jgi:hypothetical protein